VTPPSRAWALDMRALGQPSRDGRVAHGATETGERGAYPTLGRTTATYHGIAYGARAPGRRSRHRSRRRDDRPGRSGKPVAGRRAAGAGPRTRDAGISKRPEAPTWRAGCIERCTPGSEGGGWKRASRHLASRLPYLSLHSSASKMLLGIRATAAHPCAHITRNLVGSWKRPQCPGDIEGTVLIGGGPHLQLRCSPVLRPGYGSASHSPEQVTADGHAS